jgi:hypothetical protein
VLSTWNRDVLAQAFGLGHKEVGLDAALVVGWHGPVDDLLSELRTRHGWAAVDAYRYLRTLRHALRGDLLSS